MAALEIMTAPGEKLTKWKREPSIQDLKLDLEGAKQSHDNQVVKINRWNDLLSATGSAAQKKIKGRSSVQPKLIRRQAEWRYSALTEPFLGTNKLFKVSPATFEDGNGSKQNEKVLNYQFRTKLNRVKFIDDFVRSTVDEGTCIIQTGWKRHTIKVKQTVPVYSYYPIENEQDAEAFKQALEARMEDPRHFKEQATPELLATLDYFDETEQATTVEQTGEEEVEVDKILENRPTAEVKNPKNIYIDPSCLGDLNNAMFVVASFETCKADLVKEKKRYRNLDKVRWEDNSPISEPNHDTTTPNTFNMKGARKKVVAHEYWGFYDIDGNDILTPIVATWIGDVLIRMERNPFPDQKLPFVLVPYLPVKRDVYGEPDAELLEDNQKILGAVSRGLIDLLGRSANGQLGFAKGMLDPLNRRRFENGQDYEFNPNLPVQQGLIEHKYPDFPQSAMLMLNLQNQEAEALTGVKSFGGGVSGEAYGDVAAGIKGVLDAAAKREMAILRRMAKGISEVGEKFASMNQAFLSEEETIRITNEVFETVKREDLAGNFDFEVDISTAEVDNAKAQDLAFMLQTMGPNMDLSMTIMILAEIAELKRMPELAHKIRTFQPPVDPLEEERKKLEIEKLRLEVEELRTKAALNKAKAAEAQAKADMLDLDYVEQEGGTKHARDLEKQEGQAEGNKELAVTKALVTPVKKDQKKPNIEAAIGYNALTKDGDNLGGGSAPQAVDIPPQPAELPPTPEIVPGFEPALA